MLISKQSYVIRIKWHVYVQNPKTPLQHVTAVECKSLINKNLNKTVYRISKLLYDCKITYRPSRQDVEH